MRLKELRIKNNYKQQDIAKIINKTKSGYGYYETGRIEPDIKTLCKLADFYHVTLDELVGREQSNIIENGLLNELKLDLINKLQQLDIDNLLKLQDQINISIQNQQKKSILKSKENKHVHK